MALFEQALGLTLKNEGGYVNDPNDNGGETYRGISRKNFPSGEIWPYLEKFKPLHTGQIINDATLEAMVGRFYRGNFWNPIQGDSIINQEVANDLFDKAVNMGVRQAVVLSQRSLGIAETGHMDTKTLSTLNEMNPYA